jgi:Cdc6-like AAA superfamily ATPase
MLLQTDCRTVDSKLSSIDSHVQTTHTEIKSIRMDQHSSDIMQWLAPPDVSYNFNKAIKARHPGSGQRLLESKAYTTWKTGNSSFLWLYGIPGCGKTVLTSSVIEDLQRSQGQSLPHTLLYFYFDFTDSRKQSFENTLRSLVWQVYHQNEAARKHLDSLYSSACQNGKAQPNFDSLQKAFAEMIHNLKEVWIVLDALDECAPRGELLAWLRSVNQDLSLQVNMHVLVTSRPEQDIGSAIRRYASNGQMIAIRDDLLEADIRNYVQTRVREHEGLRRWRGHKEIQDQIETSLLEKANGM